MLKIIMIVVMFFPLVVGCTTTAKGKKRECQPECRSSNSDVVVLQER